MTDRAEKLTFEVYTAAAKRLLALLMEKPNARREFNTTFADLDLEAVFPMSLVDLARYTLSVDYPVTIQMVAQRSPENFLEEFAHLTPMDKTAQGVAAHVESFVTLFQSFQLSQMGLDVNPEQPVLEQIEDYASQLAALGQRRVHQRDARGDKRFAQLRAEIARDGTSGYRPLGIHQLDQYLPGMNWKDGDMGVIQGKFKTGKTRIALNILIRQLEKYPAEECTYISTEPFSSPDTIMLALWAMLATREADDNGIKFDIADTAIASVQNSQYQKYIDLAADKTAELGKRIYIYGPALEDGNAAQLNAALSILQRNLSILGHKLGVLDNFQQLQLGGHKIQVEKDYDLMLAVTRAVSSLAAQHKMVMLGLSQESQSGAMKGGGGMQDRTAWSLSPKKGKSADSIGIHCNFARKAPSPWDVTLKYFPFSGWMAE